MQADYRLCVMKRQWAGKKYMGGNSSLLHHAGDAVVIGKTTMIRRCFLICFCTLFLFSCAGSGVRQAADVTELKQEKEIDGFYIVGSSVISDFNSAVSLMQQKQYEQAVVILRKVIEREKRLPAPFVNLAIAYARLGEEDAAEKNFVKALALDSGHATANNELGLLYRKQGRFNAARTAFESAIASHPDYLPAKRNLGVLCDLYLRDFICALEQFEAYLYLKPNDRAMTIWLADVKNRIVTMNNK